MMFGLGAAMGADGAVRFAVGVGAAVIVGAVGPGGDGAVGVAAGTL